MKVFREEAYRRAGGTTYGGWVLVCEGKTKEEMKEMGYGYCDDWFVEENMETETIRRDNMINYEEILRIYRERKMKVYRQERDTKEENIEDEYTKLNKEFNEKLLKQLKKDNMENKYESVKRTTCVYTEKRDLEEKKIKDEFYKKENELDELVREVKAQLGLCSNREEVLEVLKLYNITDENGKISGSEESNIEE